MGEAMSESSVPSAGATSSCRYACRTGDPGGVHRSWSRSTTSRPSQGGDRGGGEAWGAPGRPFIVSHCSRRQQFIEGPWRLPCRRW